MRGTSRPRSPLTVIAALLVVLGTTVAWSPAPPPAGSANVNPARLPVDRAPLGESSSNAIRRPRPAPSVSVQGGAGAGAAAASVSSEPLYGTPVAQAYAGRNRFWIPELGLSQPVVPYPCNRQRPPDNYVYRWGCAGHNNVYILGHAYGVMKALANAYKYGHLHVGMIAMYADGAGHIRAYRVTTWRVVDPMNSNWAVASQPVPSMTLQTCVGPQGRLRLNVRLVAVD